MASRKRESKRGSTQPQPSGFQVGPGTMVSIQSVVFDEEGQRVDGGESHLESVFGFGQLLPSIERALDGARAGDEREVTLAPEEAFGLRDPSAVLEVDRSDFPADIQPGDCFELENASGGVLVMTVLDVSESTVLLDSNHPLAGQVVRYRLLVESVRPATQQEIEDAEECALSLGSESTACGADLIPMGQLVRRGPENSSAPLLARDGCCVTTSDAAAGDGKEAKQ